MYCVDKLYERTEWDQKVAEERTYLGSVVVEQAAGGQRQVRYQHIDRLGSPDAGTNELGQELTAEGHGFDAFGGPQIGRAHV